MPRFSVKALALAVVALLALGSNGCRSKSMAVDSRRVERLALASGDSLVRVVVAAIDSPEIMIARLDSPRTFVRLAARRASIADSLAATAYTASASASLDETHTESASTPLPREGGWMLAAFVAFIALAAEIALRYTGR